MIIIIHIKLILNTSSMISDKSVNEGESSTKQNMFRNGNYF